MESNILSFLISYLAGNVPQIKDLFEGNKTMRERINKCFKKAVERWDYAKIAKESISKNMDNYILHLKDFILLENKGRHPKENELLQLWSEEIQNDKECCHYISNLQSEAILRCVNNNRQLVNDITEDIASLHTSIDRLNCAIKSISCPTSLLCHEYWERWSIGKDICLNTQVVLCGRQHVQEQLSKISNNPQYLKLKAISIEEAFAFACASILELNDNSDKRTVVVTNQSEYELLVRQNEHLIIITNIQFNHAVAIEKGHSVVHCVSYNEANFNSTVVSLPEINREKFIEALCESGLNQSNARKIARDAAYDVNILRRHICVSCPNPKWLTDNNRNVLIMLSIIGEWNNAIEGDRELVAHISQMCYEEVLSILEPLRYVDDTPIVKIGNIWRIKSSYDLMMYLIHSITTVDLKRIQEVVEIMNMDDDPDAIDKMEENCIQFRQNKQIFSDCIKEGIYQGIALYSVISKLSNISTKWPDELVNGLLSKYDIQKYLSNKTYLPILAEASPISIIQFVKKDIESGEVILHQLFASREKQFSLAGSEIFYSELLRTLECIAWDPNYLYDVTEILLFTCKYPHDEKYANSPLNSLRQIYRFILPQTTTDFESRISILKSLSINYPQRVFDLIRYIIKDIEQHCYTYNSTFRWRMRGCDNHDSLIEPISYEELSDIVQLMLDLYHDSPENFYNLLELSFNHAVKVVRDNITTKLTSFKESHIGNIRIVTYLRKEIYHHKSFKNARWALSDNELSPYIDLLRYIEPQDVIIKNKHFFEEYNIEDPEYFIDDRDYKRILEHYKNIRETILREMVSAKGFSIIYDLSKIIEDSSYLAQTVISIYGNEYTTDVYRKLINNEISDRFMSNYFWNLYHHIGEERYIELIPQLSSIDQSKIAIFLYAPNYHKNLAIEAHRISSIENNYWKNVSIGYCEKNDIEFVISHLRAVKRYDAILKIIRHKELLESLSNNLKIDILYESISNPEIVLGSEIRYYLEDIIQSIDLPTEELQRMKLLQIEFLLHDALNGYIDVKKMHLYSIINQDCSLMIQIIKLANISDESTVQGDKNQFRINLATLAWRFLSNYNLVPCSDENGVNYSNLQVYLLNVLNACKAMFLCEHTIGKIIANIPEDDNYPSCELCKMVEYISNDNIDVEIGCELFNKRGSFYTSPFAGGYRERELIKLFETYRQRALPYSPRMVKIFTQLIQGYERDAEREDNNSRLLGLKY